MSNPRGFLPVNHGEPFISGLISPIYFSCLECQELHAHVYSRPGASTGAPKVKTKLTLLNLSLMEIHKLPSCCNST